MCITWKREKQHTPYWLLICFSMSQEFPFILLLTNDLSPPPAPFLPPRQWPQVLSSQLQVCHPTSGTQPGPSLGSRWPLQRGPGWAHVCPGGGSWVLSVGRNGGECASGGSIPWTPGLLVLNDGVQQVIQHAALLHEGCGRGSCCPGSRTDVLPSSVFP